MTETSPVATMCTLPTATADLDEEVLDDLRTSQGLPLHGVQIRICDASTGAELPWDGKASGELQVCLLAGALVVVLHDEREWVE